MASIVQGYEYDIFISYRQKDNKYDGWVTEFVNNLRKELEATFKEDISIYFDINPHDGLLETHNVQASLTDKLKCLVFIPIISQTYCDPKSFAWQNEFLAFNKISQNDGIGREVKLGNGNVANRILPVRIHDLEAEDRILLEDELKAPLRAIEFIYKSQGVNRPLKSDDSRSENLNHTYYRDQINKVANAVKELITGLKKPVIGVANISLKSTLFRNNSHNIRLRLKPAIWIFIIIGLTGFGYFILPHLSKTTEEIIDKSIAVIPFENISGDNQDYFSFGITEDILNHLYKIGGLQIREVTNYLKYKESGLSTGQIASEMGVAHVLRGSVRKQGEKVTITVKLIDLQNNIIWSENYPGDTKDVPSILSEVAQKVAIALKAKISREVAERIDRVSTYNPDAYDLFLRGINKLSDFWPKFDIAHVDTAQDFFLKATELDPQFSMAFAQLGASYWYQGHWSRQPSSFMYHESIRNLRKAIDLDPLNGVAYANLAVVEHNWLWDKEAARKSLETALTLMPGSEEVWNHRHIFFYITGDCEALIKTINDFEKSFKRDVPYDWKVKSALCQGNIDLALARDPSDMFANLAAGNLVRAKELSNPAHFSFSALAYMIYGVALVKGGQTDSAELLLRKLENIEKVRYVNPTILAVIHKALGNEAQADKYIEKAFTVRDNMLHWIMLFGPYHELKNDPKIKEIAARSWIPLKDDMPYN